MIVDAKCGYCGHVEKDIFLHRLEDIAGQVCPKCLKLALQRLWTGGPTIHFPFAFVHKGVRQPYGYDVCARQYFDSSRQQKDWAARNGKTVIPAGESLAY